MRLILNVIGGLGIAIALASCTASGNDQGTEYAPNMYHSVAYEPYSQIVDEEAGRWLTSIEYKSGHAEYYNSNNLNPFHMNMRDPAPHTVSRNKNGYLPYRIGKDSLAFAATLKSPLDSTAAVIAGGKALYEMYCDHCHGAKGAGDGKVGVGVTVDGVQKGNYNGVPDYNSGALKNISEGHIFHVITHGKGLMWAHGSQISPDDRWRIAKYVKTLQK